MSDSSEVAAEYTIHFQHGNRGRKRMVAGVVPASVERVGRTPRVAKLMALAIRIEGLVQRGEIRDYADVARLGKVTRARISQIMSFLLLTPSIQEQLLFLPLVHEGRDPIQESDLRPIMQIADWREQQQQWETAKGGG